MVEGKVFVVDDDPDVRESLERLFTSSGLCVASFDSGLSFLDAVPPNTPGCVVVDMRMPGMSGIGVQRALRERSIDLPVIVITGYGDLETGIQSMKEGAVDFVQKPFSGQLLLERVHGAIEKSWSEFRERNTRRKLIRRFEDLSEREREVLDMIVAGEPNKRIAGTLNISNKTVEFHRKNIMTKTGAKNLAELVKAALLLAESSSPRH